MSPPPPQVVSAPRDSEDSKVASRNIVNKTSTENKLNPTELMLKNSNNEDMLNSCRRRPAVGQKLNSAAELTLILPHQTPTYELAAAEHRGDGRQTCAKVAAVGAKRNVGHRNGGSSATAKRTTTSAPAPGHESARIFTITSFLVLLTACLVCLFGCLLLASGGRSSGVNAQHHSTPASMRTAPERSISRHDGDGEQIRPPLVRAPTTLAPLAAAGGHSLQAASQQDSSYMSPEMREELMRSQESHYESKPGAEQQQVDTPALAAADAHQYQRRQQQQNGLQTDASGAAGDDEDEDYEGASEPVGEGERSLLQNSAPESRRSSATNYRGRGYEAGGGAELGPPPVADMASANEDDSPQDGYGPANDEVHFSRKAAVGPAAGLLNSAASYNQNNRNYGRASAGPQDDGTADGSQGFGPGPNEAELLAAANAAGDESGAGSDDAADADPEGGDEPDARPDRRFSNELPSGNALDSLPDGSDNRADPANGPLGDGGDSADAIAASGSSVSAAGATAATRKSVAGVAPAAADASRKVAIAQMRQQAAEQWMRDQQQAHQHPADTRRGERVRPNMAPATKTAESHRPPPQQTFSARQKPRATTTSAPYNPQNNPSHAGKYFIN